LILVQTTIYFVVVLMSTT